jgi:hypothetical protein
MDTMFRLALHLQGYVALKLSAQNQLEEVCPQRYESAGFLEGILRGVRLALLG